jgi:hypothetical protein
MAVGFRRMKLTVELIDEAMERADSLPIFENSHRQEQANLVGCIGEIVFERYLAHHEITFKNDTISTRRDYVIGNSLALDVKTKDRTVRPQRHFDNSVPLYNHPHQRPDYYYFISLLREKSLGATDPRRFKEAYLMGGISLQDLDRVAKRWDAGQTDPSNGTTFWTACLNVQMDQLTPNDQLLETFRNA